MPRISSPTVWTGSSAAASAGATADATTTAGAATTGAAATGSALAAAFLATTFLVSTGAGAGAATGAGTTATSTVSFLATRFVATFATAGVEFIVLVPVEELEDILRTTNFFMSHHAQIFIFAFTFFLKFPFKIKKCSFFFEVDSFFVNKPLIQELFPFFALTETKLPA
jgi:hypothetical protein